MLRIISLNGTDLDFGITMDLVWKPGRLLLYVRFQRKASVSTHQGMIGHPRPRRRCLGLESPASHISRYHGARCQDVGKFSLKNCCQLTAAEEINQPVR